MLAARLSLRWLTSASFTTSAASPIGLHSDGGFRAIGQDEVSLDSLPFTKAFQGADSVDHP